MTTIRSLLNPDDDCVIRARSPSSSTSTRQSRAQAPLAPPSSLLQHQVPDPARSQHVSPSALQSTTNATSLVANLSGNTVAPHPLYVPTIPEYDPPSSPTSSAEDRLHQRYPLCGSAQQYMQHNIPQDMQSFRLHDQYSAQFEYGPDAVAGSALDHPHRVVGQSFNNRTHSSFSQYVPQPSVPYPGHMPASLPLMQASMSGYSTQVPLRHQRSGVAQPISHSVVPEARASYRAEMRPNLPQAAPHSSTSSPSPTYAEQAQDASSYRATTSGSSPTRRADLERNRATSSRFRQNARDEASRVTVELELLRKERRALKAYTSHLVSHGFLKSDACDGLVAPDFTAVNTTDVFLPQSPETAAILGVSKVSDPVAHVMIELIAARRAMFEKPNRSLTSDEITRLVAIDYDKCFASLRYLDDGVTLVPHELFEARFAEFYTIYRHWDEWESAGGALQYNSTLYREDDNEQRRRNRESSYVSASHIASLGVKKCRRCHILKTAGSGHRRSHCADGHLVSSDVPFMHPASVG